MEPVFRLEDVGVLRGGRRILSGVNLDVAPGDFVLVKGPSGAGKSSLLRLLCRLDAPAEGRVFFNGRDAAALEPRTYRTRVVYVQQTPVAVEGTVRDNLLLPFAFKANAALARPGDQALAASLAEFRLNGVGLDQPARELSVGQKQRLCLIRSLMLSPEAVLMDEPTSALDQESAAVVLDAAERLNADKGVTVAMITHSGHEARFPEARRLRVEDGRAVWA